MNPRDARIARKATNSNINWKNRAKVSTFILSSAAKFPCVPTGDGQTVRFSARPIPRPIISRVTKIARPVPMTENAQSRSGRFRHANPRTAEASAVATRIASGRTTPELDTSEAPENPLGPAREEGEEEDRHAPEDGAPWHEDRDRHDLEPSAGLQRRPFRL